MNNTKDTCEVGRGALPGCLPLALAYVPAQSAVGPVYAAEKALSRGTLFPGLDLPFMDMVNAADAPDTPLGQVMVLEFVCHELLLYLDTHPADKEAFAALQGFLKLAREARERYTELYGPLTARDLAEAGSFTWAKDPWPWDGAERSGR